VITSIQYREHAVADIVSPPGTVLGALLLWHGRGDAERGSLRGIAAALAQRGVLVIVPDLIPSSDSPGLIESMQFAARLFSEANLTARSQVVGGWSWGARSAICAPTETLEWHGSSRVLALSGRYDLPSPFTGSLAISTKLDALDEVLLVHAKQDSVNSAASSVNLAEALGSAGTKSTLLLTEGDHASTIGSRFDHDLQLCLPSPEMLEANSDVIDTIFSFIVETRS
jgi:dienelactone hydrolase